MLIRNSKHFGCKSLEKTKAQNIVGKPSNLGIGFLLFIYFYFFSENDWIYKSDNSCGGMEHVCHGFTIKYNIYIYIYKHN